jgi:hypothetical protein
VPLVKSVQIDIGVKGDAASKAKLDGISRKAEELKKAFPEYTLKIDSAAATERLKVFREQLRAIPNETTTTVKVKVDSSALDKLSKSGFLKPSGLGIAAALSPSLIPLAGGIAGAVGAIGVSFGAAAAGAGLFGLAATSVLSQASSDAQKLSALNAKLATAQTAAQKKAVRQQIDALTIGWAKGYANLIGQYQDFHQKWKAASQAIAVPALTTWLGALTKGLPLLVTAVKPVADVFQNWGQILKDNFSSPAIMKNLQGMAAAFGRFSAGQLTLVGGAIADIALGVFHLGKDLAGSGANFSSFGIWLNNIGSGFLTWSKSKQARDDVQGFLGFMHKNGALVTGILQDLGKILPGILQGVSGTGQLELQAISGLLGGIANLPKGWQKPLTEAAGAILLLSKTGVVSTGLKVAFPKEGAGKLALAGSLGMRLVAGAFIVPAAVMIIGTIIPPDTNKQAAKDFKNQPDIVVKISDFFHVTGMGAWVDQYFSHPIRKWALTTLPDALDTAASKIGVFLTRTIPTDALKMAFSVTGTFAKLPGPLGEPFKKAHTVIAGELAKIQFNAAHTFGQIQSGINAFHGKKVALTFGLNLPAGVSFPSRPIKGRAAGWLVPGSGGGDTVPAMLTPGEAVVPRRLVPAVAPFLSANRVPGFAAGGLAGPAFAGNFPSGSVIRGDDAAMQRAVSSIAAAVKGLLHINRSAFTSFGAAGPGGGAPGSNAALARRMFPGENFAAWNYVAMRESGWNQFARNPSSGAYGIAQALPPTKYPFAGQAAGGSNPAAQISWMEGYMRSRYGGALGAAAHERAFNWYDKGGWLMPGLTLAMNKTGKPERILPPGHSSATPVVVQFRAAHGDRYGQFLLNEIQKLVTNNGGGDVQATFGQKA